MQVNAPAILLEFGSHDGSVHRQRVSRRQLIDGLQTDPAEERQSCGFSLGFAQRAKPDLRVSSALPLCRGGHLEEIPSSVHMRERLLAGESLSCPG